MEDEKSWIGWFIEDWQRYNHALVFALSISYFYDLPITNFITANA